MEPLFLIERTFTISLCSQWISALRHAPNLTDFIIQSSSIAKQWRVNTYIIQNPKYNCCGKLNLGFVSKQEFNGSFFPFVAYIPFIMYYSVNIYRFNKYVKHVVATQIVVMAIVFFFDNLWKRIFEFNFLIEVMAIVQYRYCDGMYGNESL